MVEAITFITDHSRGRGIEPDADGGVVCAARERLVPISESAGRPHDALYLFDPAAVFTLKETNVLKT